MIMKCERCGKMVDIEIKVEEGTYFVGRCIYCGFNNAIGEL